MNLRTLLLLLLLLIPSSGFADDTPDSRSAPDEPALRVILQDGGTLWAQRIRTGSLGLVTVTRKAEPDTVISANRIRSITDEHGRDRTRDVLVNGQPVRVGDPPPREKWKRTARQRGLVWGAQAGAIVPIRSFGNLAETGFGASATVELRTGRRDAYGLRLDALEFGGNSRLEEAIASGSGGAVDRLRYRVLGISLISKFLILPDRRVSPFLLYTLGVQSFTTKLSGPVDQGSRSAFAFAQDLGAGVDISLNRRVILEFLFAYTQTNIRRNTTTAGDVSFTTRGTAQYLQYRVGLSRRIGGGD